MKKALATGCACTNTHTIARTADMADDANVTVFRPRFRKQCAMNINTSVTQKMPPRNAASGWIKRSAGVAFDPQAVQMSGVERENPVGQFERIRESVVEFK